MNVTIMNRFTIPKDGNDSGDNEDAFFIGKDNFTIAISDGATEASFSREWANHIVEYISNNYQAMTPTEWIDNCCDTFSGKIDVSTLPWYAEAKYISQGSFATIALVKVYEDIIHCFAVGDSCVFFVDNSSTGVAIFPYSSSEQFANLPILFGSSSQFNREIVDKIHQCIFNYNIIEKSLVDCYMCTDALSLWILKNIENNVNPFILLNELQTQSSFEIFVKELREKKSIRNDDVTLLRISIEK